jgi:hypothetical protein
MRPINSRHEHQELLCLIIVLIYLILEVLCVVAIFFIGWDRWKIPIHPPLDIDWDRWTNFRM